MTVILACKFCGATKSLVPARTGGRRCFRITTCAERMVRARVKAHYTRTAQKRAEA